MVSVIEQENKKKPTKAHEKKNDQKCVLDFDNVQEYSDDDDDEPKLQKRKLNVSNHSTCSTSSLSASQKSSRSDSDNSENSKSRQAKETKIRFGLQTNEAHTVARYIRKPLFNHIKFIDMNLITNKPKILNKCFEVIGIKDDDIQERQLRQYGMVKFLKDTINSRRGYISENVKKQMKSKLLICAS